MAREHNCYECIYREDLHHSHHSRCNLLKTAATAVHQESAGSILELGIASGAMSLTDSNTGEPVIKISEHGKRNGWADWPVNFDPIWIDECPAFTKKPEQ